MAKRFTDTDKWKKPFLRSLPAAYKLLWIYILDECDHAGIWQVDLDVAQIKIGEILNPSEAIEYFGNRIVELDNGTKWFISDFVEFQYGNELNPNNRTHNSVIKILSKYNLIRDDGSLISSPNKPLVSPLGGVKDKDKDKDKDKQANSVLFVEELRDGDVVLPFQTETFFSAWNEWLDYRKERKLTKYKPRGLTALFKDFRRYSEEVVIASINKSMRNNWQGLFPEKITQADLVKLIAPGKHELPKAKYHNYEQQYGNNI